MKYVSMIVVAAMMAVSSNPAATTMAGSAEAEIPGVNPAISPLDKTWTTRGQENKAGSQVLVFRSLTSPVSFPAEGTGFEPATGFPAPHFQCGR